MNKHPDGPVGAPSSEWAVSTYKIAPPRAGHRIAVTEIRGAGAGAPDAQRLYMIGGYSNPASSSPFPNTTQTYGIGVDEPGWHDLNLAQFTNRWGHGVAVTRGTSGVENSYVIWAIGGASSLRFGAGGATPNTALSSVQYIMPNAPARWLPGPPLPEPVYGRFMAGVTAFENIIYVTGGRDSAGVFHSSMLKMDATTPPPPGGVPVPTDMFWDKTGPSMIWQRAAHGLAMTSDGKLWAAGGLSGASLQTPPDLALKSVEYLDISKNAVFWQNPQAFQTQDAFMSIGRANFQLIAIGMVLYAIGGQSGVWLGEDEGVNTVEFLDTRRQPLVWKSAPPMNNLRFQLGAAAAAGGPAGAPPFTPYTLLPPALYAVGGLADPTSSSAALTSVESYTPPSTPPPSSAWVPIAPMGTPRIRHGVGRLRTSSDAVLQVYAVGGQDGSTLLKSAEVLLAAGWKAIASMSTARVGLGVAFLGTKMYAVGGMDSNGTVLVSVEAYDTATYLGWTDIAPMSISRSGVGVASLGSYLYAVGGLSSSGTGIAVGSVERYSPSGGWANISSGMQTPREGLGVAAVGLFLYAVGGTDSNGTVLASVERYDPTANVWAPMTSMGTARHLLGVAALGGKLYAVGGKDSAGNSLASVEVYDPATNTWDQASSANPLPDDIWGPGVTVSPTKLFVVGGGKTTATALKTGFSYTPPTI